MCKDRLLVLTVIGADVSEAPISVQKEILCKDWEGDATTVNGENFADGIFH